MPEVLNDSALFFDPNNHQEMADQIKIVLTDKNIKEKLLEKAKNNIRRFSWHKCAKNTLEAYQSIFKKSQ